MKEIAMLIGLSAAVYGLSELIARVAFRLLFPKKGRDCWVVALCGRPEDAEYTVRRLSIQRRLSLTDAADAVILDCGMDEQSRESVMRLCGETSSRLYTAEEFCKMLSAGLQESEEVV